MSQATEAETKKAVVKIDTGNHTGQSIPSGMETWLAGKLEACGLFGMFKGHPSARSPHTTGIVMDEFRAIRVEGESVLIQCKPGKNDTCRRLYIRSTDPKISAQEVKVKIDAVYAPVKGKGSEDVKKDEDNNGKAPLKIDVSPEAISLYLLALREAMRNGQVSLRPAREAIRSLLKQPGQKRVEGVDEVLEHLGSAGYLDPSERQAGSRKLVDYRFTESGESLLLGMETVKEVIAETPTPGKPPQKPSLINFSEDHAKMVQGLVDTVKPHEEQIKLLPRLREKQEAARVHLLNLSTQIAEVEASVPPEAVEAFEKLHQIAKKLEE